MEQGTLVAASDVGGHRELIRDGDTGTLFRPDDPVALAQAVARLFAERDGWDARRERGRAQRGIESIALALASRLAVGQQVDQDHSRNLRMARPQEVR